MLAGPYQVSDVDSHVNRESPGVYVLSKDGKSASYVGRSDVDVAARIKASSSERGDYTHFWFEYTPSAKEAYVRECEYYHRYNPSDNTNHPAAPVGTNWKCPVMGCPWS